MPQLKWNTIMKMCEKLGEVRITVDLAYKKRKVGNKYQAFQLHANPTKSGRYE